MNAVSVKDLTVAFNNKPIIWDIDLEIPHGVLLAIVGPNGAGKTTLIKAILNIIKQQRQHQNSKRFAPPPTHLHVSFRHYSLQVLWCGILKKRQRVCLKTAITF